jgi:hypothetical protein
MDRASVRRGRQQATVRHAENFIFIIFLMGMCQRNSVYVFDYFSFIINNCHVMGGLLIMYGMVTLHIRNFLSFQINFIDMFYSY